MTNHELGPQLDHLVDTRQLSYSEAYQELGLPVPPVAPLLADATSARLSAQGYYDKEFRLTGPFQSTEEQQRAFQVSINALRAVHQASLSQPSVPSAEKPWSPSDILATMPADREPDARERQLPPSDR